MTSAFNPPPRRTRSTKLTPRGILLAIICAGLAVPGILLGSNELVAIALAVLVIIGVSFCTEFFSRPPLLTSLTFYPQPAHGGDTLTIAPQLENFGPIWSLDFKLDPKLTTATRIGKTELNYAAGAKSRGVFEFGKILAQREDVLGFARTTVTWTIPQLITIYPRLFDLGVPHSGTGGGEGRGFFPAPASSDDVTLRTYVRGDEIRRIHWAATARQGELMVRSEESSAQNVLSIILDNRAIFADSRPSEWAISAAASVGVNALNQQWRVQLITAQSQNARKVAPVFTQERALLEFATDLALNDQDKFIAAIRHAKADLTVAFLQDLDEDLHRELTQLSTQIRAAVYRGPGGALEVPELATSAKLAITHVHTDDDLAKKWREFIGASR